jgi:hypothetical protein
MQKKVTLELTVDQEFDSTTYSRVGDLLAYLEDSDFEISNVKIEDFPKLVMTSTRLGTLR